MSIKEVSLGINEQSTTYGPIAYGSQAGTPCVELVVSSSDERQKPVQSIESRFDNWSWKRKMRTGFARLRFSGRGVVNGEFDGGISDLCRLLDAALVDFEIKPTDIESRPSRTIQNLAANYSVFVPRDNDFDENALQFFADQSQKHGNVDFLFKTEKTTDEEWVKDIVDEYRIYDSDVWLYPKGTIRRTVAERQEFAIDIAKRNTWNVSPRLDITGIQSEDDE